MSPARRKSTSIEITWRHPTTGGNVRIRVDHTRNYLLAGTDHIEIHVVRPAKAAIPITDTGYRSHFIDATELKEAGGPKCFVEAWLQREAQSKEWQKRDLAQRQTDLFQWADANAETAKRKTAPKKPAAAAPRRKGRAPSTEHG